MSVLLFYVAVLALMDGGTWLFALVLVALYDRAGRGRWSRR